MNIAEEVSFDNGQRGNESLDSQRPSEPVATFTFDNTGHVERFPLWRRLFLALVIILVASLSFAIGRLTTVGTGGKPVKIEFDPALGTSQPMPQTASAIQAISAGNTNAAVVASKSGSKYHYAHCAGAKQIKEANKLAFPTPVAAEAAGYTLAANCRPK